MCLPRTIRSRSSVENNFTSCHRRWEKSISNDSSAICYTCAHFVFPKTEAWKLQRKQRIVPHLKQFRFFVSIWKCVAYDRVAFNHPFIRARDCLWWSNQSAVVIGKSVFKNCLTLEFFWKIRQVCYWIMRSRWLDLEQVPSRPETEYVPPGQISFPQYKERIIGAV